MQLWRYSGINVECGSPAKSVAKPVAYWALTFIMDKPGGKKKRKKNPLRAPASASSFVQSLLVL